MRLALALVCLAPSLASAQLAPLSDAERSVVDAIEDGVGGEVDRSYPVTNEWGHRVWFPHLDGLGGALVGVGADQSYTLAAAAGSELLFMVDYDPVVPLIHRIYQALVPPSADAEALIARFSADQEEASVALIERAFEEPLRSDVVAQYRRWRGRLERYLENAHRYRHGRTWMSHPPWYAHVRALHAAGRVVPRVGDLTADDAMPAIAAAARRLGVTVRVLYLSNAEQFFPNRPQFIENVRALPTDARSIVLRTVHAPPLEPVPQGRWHYIVQPHADMLRRLDTGRYVYRSSIALDLVHAGRRRPREVEGLSVLDERIPMREAR